MHYRNLSGNSMSRLTGEKKKLFLVKKTFRAISANFKKLDYDVVEFFRNLENESGENERINVFSTSVNKKLETKKNRAHF